jgi:lipopolysaccharide/colanic/teichoic acid biosynthesis glycosyltransferase
MKSNIAVSLAQRQRIAKRIADLVVAIFLLVLTAPLMILVAIAIRLDSPGTILFSKSELAIVVVIFKC